MTSYGTIPDEHAIMPELDHELATYRRELPRLLTAEGRFVQIMGDQVAGVFDAEEDALEAGYDRFGLDTPFFVKQIVANEKPFFIPTALLVRHAASDSAHSA